MRNVLAITIVERLVAQGPIVLISRSVDVIIFVISIMSMIMIMIMIIFMLTLGFTDIALSRGPLPP